MNQIAKSLLTLTIGLGLSGAAAAQAAPSEAAKPKPSASAPEKPKTDAHAKHSKLSEPQHTAVVNDKTPNVKPDSSKPLQPLAAGKKAVTEKTADKVSDKSAVAAKQPSKKTAATKAETPVDASKAVK